MTDTTPTPDAETIAWTTHLAGCDEAVHRGQRLGWCITHGMKKRTPWPCPVAVDLAAKITARDARRDAQTRADECEAIAAVTTTIRTESMRHPSERGDEEWTEGMHDALQSFSDRMRERAHRERVQG